MSELVLPLELGSGETPRYQNGEEACSFGIQPANGLPTLFGDTFLRSAYAVYDLVNNKIALANTDFNVTDSNIVPFASQGASIPSASAAAQTAVASAIGTAPGGHVDPGAGGSSGGSTTIGPGASASSSLAASAGLQQDSPSSSTTSSSKKSAGTTVPAFDWSMLSVVVGSFSMMVMGGGLFVAL